VAIAAINAQAADVVLMAERRILHDGFAFAGDVGGALQLRQQAAYANGNEQAAENRNPRE